MPTYTLHIATRLGDDDATFILIEAINDENASRVADLLVMAIDKLVQVAAPEKPLDTFSHGVAITTGSRYVGSEGFRDQA